MEGELGVAQVDGLELVNRGLNGECDGDYDRLSREIHDSRLLEFAGKCAMQSRGEELMEV